MDAILHGAQSFTEWRNLTCDLTFYIDWEAAITECVLEGNTKKDMYSISPDSIARERPPAVISGEAGCSLLTYCK